MAKEKDESKGKKMKIEKERSEFKALIAKNPNYFGTSPDTKRKAVSKMKNNTKYEEIRCVGFYPELDLLEAIIDVKLPYGYKGNLCKNGSFEYIRFFIDWDGDGDFTDPDEDVGIVSVNVHDIPNEKELCIVETKPLSYGLTLKIDSKKRHCKIPNLIKVRAILSWDNPPSAGDPDFPVVWGNVVEHWIQIKAIKHKFKHIIQHVDLEKLDLKASMLDLDAQITKVEKISPSDLKEIYKKQNVPQHRYNYVAINQVAEQIKKTPSVMAECEIDPQFKKIKKSVQTILKAKSSTKYEGLNCVGLNYARDQLMATMTIKLPYGYSGDLCADGSNEYVAFWAYIYDEIEQTCVWRYLGTTSVNVHDIKTLPPGGLKYAVYMPVDLSSFKDTCQNPKILRVRAILSWNTKPDPDDPNQNPVWGNKKDALIQIKPDKVIKPEERRPRIWTVGTMAVESISGNPDTVVPSALGDGYANGVSLHAGFTAVESPFGGRIAIGGRISNAPDNPAPANKLKYKVQYKKSGGTWKDITDKFRIWLRVNDIPAGHLDQTIDSGGYFTYHSDEAIYSTPPKVEVQNDIMAIWHTPVSDGNGIYALRLLLFEPGTPPQPDVPANHIASQEVKIVIDNRKIDPKEPNAAISLDLGGCQEYTVGDDYYGKFTAIDPHIYRYSITVLPTSVANRPTVSPSSSQYPVLPAPGVTDQTFTLTTTDENTPCGYVLRLWVRDRAIVNNSFPGNRTSADVGFCLVEEEDGT